MYLADTWLKFVGKQTQYTDKFQVKQMAKKEIQGVITTQRTDIKNDLKTKTKSKK